MQLIHPFHPRSGEEFEFLGRLSSWRGDVVLVLDTAGRRCSFPVEWTDLALPDPFVALAGGRCPFRVQDLVELADLVDRLRAGRSQGVTGTMP